MEKIYGNPDVMHRLSTSFEFILPEGFEVTKVIDYLKNSPEYAINELIFEEHKTDEFHAFCLMARNISIEGVVVAVFNDGTVLARIMPFASPGDVRLLIDFLSAVSKLYYISAFLCGNDGTIFYPTEENYAKLVSQNLQMLNCELLPEGRRKIIPLRGLDLYYATVHNPASDLRAMQQRTIQVMEERLATHWKYCDIPVATRLELVRDKKKQTISFLKGCEPVIFNDTYYIGIVDRSDPENSKICTRKTFEAKLLDLGYGKKIDAVRLLVDKLDSDRWQTLYDSFRNSFVDSPSADLL